MKDYLLLRIYPSLPPGSPLRLLPLLVLPSFPYALGHHDFPTVLGRGDP